MNIENIKDDEFKYKGCTVKYKIINELYNYTIQDCNCKVIQCGDSKSKISMIKVCVEHINMIIDSNTVSEYFIGKSREGDVELCVEYKSGNQQILAHGIKPHNQDKVEEILENANLMILLKNHLNIYTTMR